MVAVPTLCVAIACPVATGVLQLQGVYRLVKQGNKEAVPKPDADCVVSRNLSASASQQAGMLQLGHQREVAQSQLGHVQCRQQAGISST
jgi:hypothetical protein